MYIRIFFFFFERAHEVLNVTNYVIIGKEYWNNTRKRKIAKVLLIREFKPKLNRQGQSIALTIYCCQMFTNLFNICFTDLEHENIKIFFVS